MFFSTLATLVCLGVSSIAGAKEWHATQFYTDPGQGYIQLSGEMVVPRLPRAGVYYLWPGLQPTDGSGVFQPVLDGRSGSWWMGTGWCCSNPSLPWGAGFGVVEGDTVSFDMRRNNEAWITNLKVPEKGLNADGSFPLCAYLSWSLLMTADKTMDMAIFAIELSDVPWDFGTLAFKNIVMVIDCLE